MTRQYHWHGHAIGGKSKTYNVWRAMRKRCGVTSRHTKNAAAAKVREHYMGRGITVCDRWKHRFDAFLEDMGEKPEGLSIDRIDNNKGYCKENCRWATRQQQNENRSSVVAIPFMGKTLIQRDWAKELGVAPSAISYRIRRGQTPAQAVEHIYMAKLGRDVKP